MKPLIVNFVLKMSFFLKGLVCLDQKFSFQFSFAVILFVEEACVSVAAWTMCLPFDLKKS